MLKGLPAVSQTEIDNHKAKVEARRAELVDLVDKLVHGIHSIVDEGRRVPTAVVFMDRLDTYIDEAFKERERQRRGDPAWGIED